MQEHTNFKLNALHVDSSIHVNKPILVVKINLICITFKNTKNYLSTQTNSQMLTYNLFVI